MPLQLIKTLFDEPPHSGISVDDLIGESNHRIANNLTVIAGLVRLQSAEVARAGRPLTPEEVCQLLKEVSNRIDTVSRLHRLLARAACDDRPDLGGYLADVATTVISSLSGSTPAAELELDVECHSVLASQALSLGFIVGELVTNAVKYAHPTGVTGRIRLICRQVAGGATLLEVADDGVGLPEGFDPAHEGGLGLRLVRSLSGQLGALLTFDQPGIGLRARLTVPPANMVRVA